MKIYYLFIFYRMKLHDNFRHLNIGIGVKGGGKDNRRGISNFKIKN